MELSDAKKGARILFESCLNIGPSDNVLIVTDSYLITLAQFLATEASGTGAEITLSTMTPRKTSGEEPPPPVAAAMKTADAVMMITTYALAPSIARAEAQESGARILCLEAYDFSVLQSQALRADFSAIRPTVELIAMILSDAEEARITSPNGTDIKMTLGSRRAYALHNICHEPGTMGSPPDIEAFVAPLEDTAQGVVSIDGSIILPEFGLLNKPIKLIFQSGNVVAVEGGAEAEKLRNILKSFNDPQMYRLCELGIGLNPFAKLVGIPLIDEGVLGTAHIALGLNYTFGGAIKDAKAHIDFVFRDPTILLDGVTIMRNGALLGIN